MWSSYGLHHVNAAQWLFHISLFDASPIFSYAYGCAHLFPNAHLIPIKNRWRIWAIWVSYIYIYTYIYILKFFLEAPVRVFPKLPPGALAEFRSSWSASASRRTRLASRMVLSSERMRFTTCRITGPLELWGWIKDARDAYKYILHHVTYCHILSDIVMCT